MNYIQAMCLIHDHPVGPHKKRNVKQKAVTRPGMFGMVFYDSTKFLGLEEFGFRWIRDPDSDPIPHNPSIDDIKAEDWCEYDWSTKSK